MARRTEAAAEAAAAAASEAARVLQARQQEALKAKAVEPSPEPAPETPAEKPTAQPSRGPKLTREPEKSEREMRLEEIRKARGEPEGDELPTEPEKPEPAAAKPSAPAPAVEQPAPEAPAPEAPKMVKVKVDGDEMEVPEADVEAAGGVTAYQRDKASENRLAKAKEALEESKKTQALTAKMAEWMLSQQQQKPPEAPKQTDAQFISERIDKMRFGTPDESAAALQEIIQRGQSKAPDHNAIVHAAVQETQRLQAIQTFVKEFEDINTNPILGRAAVALVQDRMGQLRGQQSPVDWQKFYRTIGTEIRSAFGRQSQSAAAPSATPGTTSQPSEKEARKASIMNLPTAASARATPPAEEKPQTREESLNAMRKARGQPAI